MSDIFSILGRTCGIYCIIHRDSGMCYVGSSINVHDRVKGHVVVVNRRKSKSYFYRVLREFGQDAFDYELIETCTPEEKLNREDFWISFYDSAGPDGLNTAKKATGAPVGREVSEATRERIGAYHRGKKLSEEHLEKLRNPSPETRFLIGSANRGKKLSGEHKARIGKASLGHTLSEESRKKVSDGKKGKPRPDVSERLRGKPGRKWTVEQIESMRSKLKARSEEISKFISQRNLGKKHSEETIEKIRAWNTGRKMSEEACKKMSVAAKKRTLCMKRGEDGKFISEEV